jgi:hypothetical protein
MVETQVALLSEEKILLLMPAKLEEEKTKRRFRCKLEPS